MNQISFQKLYLFSLEINTNSHSLLTNNSLSPISIGENINEGFGGNAILESTRISPNCINESGNVHNVSMEVDYSDEDTNDGLIHSHR